MNDYFIFQLAFNLKNVLIKLLILKINKVFAARYIVNIVFNN